MSLCVLPYGTFLVISLDYILYLHWYYQHHSCTENCIHDSFILSYLLPLTINPFKIHHPFVTHPSFYVIWQKGRWNHSIFLCKLKPCVCVPPLLDIEICSLNYSKNIVNGIETINIILCVSLIYNISIYNTIIF